MTSDEIVESAFHEIKYPDYHSRSDPEWPYYPNEISGQQIITERDLEVVLKAVVEKIMDEFNERISELRIR